MSFPVSKRRGHFYFVLCAALVGAGLACALPGSVVTPDPVLEAFEQEIAMTATARAAEQGNEGDSVATVQAQATESTNFIQATQTAQANLSQQEAAATRAAFGPILAELPKYGVDPESGRPAWVHPPLTIDVSGYMQYDYANQYIGTVAEDFVLSADITWNTQYGSTGCGFILRTNGDEENLDAYLAVATRFGNGRVLFGTIAQNEIVNGKDFYAYGLDPNFDWKNDTTNRLTVVGRGTNMQIYTNDTLIGDFDVTEPPPRPYIPPPPASPADPDDKDQVAAYEAAKAEYDSVVAQINSAYNRSVAEYEARDVEFLKGFVAFVALNESGTTHCEFDNAWLFLIGE